MIETCKRFHEIFLASGKLLGKIIFNPTFKESRDFHEIPYPDLLQCRMAEIPEPYELIWWRKFHEASPRSSLNRFAIKDWTNTIQLTNADLALVRVTVPNFKREFSIDNHFDSGLESLENRQLTPFSSNCSKLKKFSFELGRRIPKEFLEACDGINDLLSRQSNLKFLKFQFNNDDFIIMDLTNDSWIGLKHKNIKMLRAFLNSLQRAANAMRTICQVKDSYVNCNESGALKNLDGPESRSVEIVRSSENLEVYGRNSMFRNLKKIVIGFVDRAGHPQGVFELDVPFELLNSLADPGKE